MRYLFLFALILLLAVFANFTDEPVTGIGVAIDGEKIDLEEPVILIEGTIYIPRRLSMISCQSQVYTMLRNLRTR